MRQSSSERARVRYEARQAARALLPPHLAYPEDLPITARKDEILAALAASQVLVVAGETGSGKSTQLPKLCLEAGRGDAGMIGHTQPRRIAARSIAERVAEELGVSLASPERRSPVGYKVRFTDRVNDATLLKVMTDGVLLAELHSDPELRSYDTLIIDEAHERSLNIDFILGYVKRLLPSRPDLKVIITSATIDTERFSRHFDRAPVIEVTGRTYPVEVRYQPLDAGEDGSDDEEPLDEVQAVCNAVEALCHEGPGDILVFLPGEREIRDTAEALAKSELSQTGQGALDVLALYGRLSSHEQHRIFEPHTGRRAVLATNVAETSLTVPGIRFVVDLGTARISRYSRRTKVQRLPIEPISQASANQRAGRCGRLGPGICVRLYSEEDFASRDPFTEPEILRTNLASVVLQMAAIGLGDVEGFPFVDPPDRRNIKDGVALLEELGALVQDAGDRLAASRPRSGPAGTHRDSAPSDAAWRLSAVGRKLARLPLDPRLGRMVLEGARLGCLEEVLVVTAGLSVQDPRERPADKRDMASALHSRFTDQSSDFMSYLSLWRYLEQRQAELSSSQFRRLCRKELISYQRAREWQDIVAQLEDFGRQMGLAHGGPVPSGAVTSGGSSEVAQGAKRANIHQALLSGLLTQVGLREGDRTDFAAPRGARFAIWPGSVAAKKPPRWVMAAELVETSRLWGRVVAPVRPQWVEKATAHLLKWSYSEASWDADRGAAVVLANATLYGLPVVTRRVVELSRLDQQLAREMFIYHGLIEGDGGSDPHRDPAFVGDNRELLGNYRALLQRARRPDLMVGDEALADFYRSRLGPEVTSSTTFWAWWKRLPPTGRARLTAASEDLWGPSRAGLDPSDFPDGWAGTEARSLDLQYLWEPGSNDDGVHVVVPLADLETVAREGLEWQVPGLREELVVALLRSLPKELRRHLVPIPERAREFVAKTAPQDGPLLAVLAREASIAAGAAVSVQDFDWSKVPSYLRPTLEVVGDEGQVLAAGKDVATLVAELRPQLNAALQAAAAGASIGAASVGGTSVRASSVEDTPGAHSTSWDFGELPRVFEPEWNGRRLRGYPALADEGDGVSVSVFSDEPSARMAMAAGTRRLLLLNLPSRRQLVDGLERRLGNRISLALAALPSPPYRSVREVVEDVLAAGLDQVVRANGGPAWGPEGFEVLVLAARRQILGVAEKAVDAAGRVISKLPELRRRSGELAARAIANRSEASSMIEAAIEDMTLQLAALAGPGFVSYVGIDRLPDIERYLAAIDRRLEKLPADPRRDFALTRRVKELQRQLAAAASLVEQDRARPGGQSTARLQAMDEARWMIEELRVSFFAQSLGTRVPVSEQKVARFLNRAVAIE
jgi:ATP-dependent helicase HrpA